MLRKHKEKIIFFLIIFFFPSFVPHHISAKENKTVPGIVLSLEESISIAFKNNKDIRIQKEEIRVAKAGILEAQSQLLPKLNLDASYVHTGEILSLSSSVLSSTKKDSGVVTGYKNDNQLGLSLTDVVYNGGANISGLKQSIVSFNAQKEILRARELAMEFETKRLYYGLLLAIETRRIAQELLDQSKEHYEDVKRKFEQGTASKFDLLQSKVQVSKVFPEVVKAENAVDLTMADLNKLLGLDVRTYITPKESLSFLPIEIEEEEFLKQAYLNQPEMILKSLGIDIEKWNIKIAKASNRPQVNAGLGYSYRSNDIGDMFNNKHSNWNAGFTVSIPIFDGFSSRAKVERAKSRYIQSILEKTNLIDRIAVEIRQACLDLEYSRAIIDSQEANVGEAEEALRISEVRYDNGVGINLDVLDAQVSLSQIEENLSGGIYDYLMAKASLDRTMGKSILRSQ
ncbi:MAG: TolC family protein [Candidatus Omnitrophota bacterium]